MATFNSAFCIGQIISACESHRGYAILKFEFENNTDKPLTPHLEMISVSGKSVPVSYFTVNTKDAESFAGKSLPMPPWDSHAEIIWPMQKALLNVAIKTPSGDGNYTLRIHSKKVSPRV